MNIYCIPTRYNQKKSECEKRKEERWIRWMKIGERTGCHQRADRSFFIGGYQMPVCARCTGVLIGYIAGVISFFRRGSESKKQGIFAITGCLAMFTDWFLQAIHVKESTNLRRLITGIAGGFGLMKLWGIGLKKLYQHFARST